LFLLIGQNTPLCLTDAHVPRGAILVEVFLTVSFPKKIIAARARVPQKLDQKANVFDSAEAGH
jgi:hypothetical protein